MAVILDVIFYGLIFLSVYVQVFFLITFLENRKKILVRSGKVKLDSYPAVTIAVPCWNEEKTVERTVHSLLNLNYPKDKVKIFLIDDGSTDNTWNIISQFAKYPNVKVLRKENGGKYTALNLALSQTDTEFFGGFDADSVADPESLVRIMSYFEKDPSIMAVTPTMLACDSNKIIQKIQKAEYYMGIYLKKMLGFLGGIHVTPGPLATFRKKVFDDLGPYRHAHNTEDLEIAYRMQKNHYKIEQCNDACVYTNTPATVKKLYKQRSRWIYGFINNTLDYKNVIFRKKYGNFSVFTLPTAIISLLTVVYLFSQTVYHLFSFLYSKIVFFQTTGWRFPDSTLNFDLFFINAQVFFPITIFLFALVICSIILGQKIADGRYRFSIDMFYFSIIYSVIAPLWILKAIFSSIVRRKPDWR